MKTNIKKRKMRESLIEILKIHSIWLSEGQMIELREDLKNGKSLDEELYEKVSQWFNQLKYTYTEWSETAKGISYRCLINSWKNLKDVFQRADIGLMATVTLNDTDAECNYFRSDLEKLAEIVDNKRTRNDIVEKYCDLRKNNAMKRYKRESKGGGTNSENNLEYYFEILNLNWLDDQQRKCLKNMSTEGTRLTMRDAVVNWFNHLQPEAKERAANLFKGGCNKLLKIRQDGCGYFGSLDTQKIDELKNYDDLTTFSKIKELIDPLQEKVELRQIANEYSQSCRELFDIGEEEGESWYIGVGRKRRSYNRRDSRPEQESGEESGEEDNRDYNSSVLNVEANNNEQSGTEDDGEEHDFGDEHLNAHREWLNSDQKRHIKRMKQKGHEDHEIHDKINEFHETSPEEIKITAKGILKRGCESVFKRLFGEYIAEEIIQAREQGASRAELDEKINTALGHIKNAKKRKEATRFAATCRRIFTMIERRRRDALSTPIEDSP